MRNTLNLTILLFAIINSTNAQVGLAGSTWNYHFSREASPNTEYYHLGTYTANTDTTIMGNTYYKIQSNTGVTIDYLRKTNEVVWYYYNNEELRFFYFIKHVNDSFYIDMKLGSNFSNMDTVVKDVLVKIESITYAPNTTQTDSVKVFNYAILSSNIKSIYPDLPLPYPVLSGISAQLLNLKMANYNQVSFSSLFNPNVNLGPDTKPFLTCFENTNTSFSYKSAAFISNQLACNYSSPTGLNTALNQPSNITIYPNPTIDKLYFTANTSIIKQIAIYNTNGQLIRSLNYKQLLPQNSVDVANLPNGIYQLILVAEDGGIFSNRFVKQ